MFSSTAALVAAGAALLYVITRSAGGNGGDAVEPATPVSGGKVIGLDGSDVTRNFSAQVLRWAADVRPVADGTGLDARVLLSVMQQESGGVPQPGALDEYGLMQLRPIAVRDVAQNTAFPFVEPEDMTNRENIRYGAEFLRLQKRRTDGTYYEALRAYNAGFSGARSSPSAGAQYASDVLGRINMSRSAR
jgi:soluble lytic murein transglycosylase-like protein